MQSQGPGWTRPPEVRAGEHAHATRAASAGGHPTDPAAGASTPTVPSSGNPCQSTGAAHWAAIPRPDLPSVHRKSHTGRTGPREARGPTRGRPGSPPSRPGSSGRRGGWGVGGRGAGPGWQGLFGGPRRKERRRRRRYCDFFQQFLGLSGRSQPLPPRPHLPRCGGGSSSASRYPLPASRCRDVFSPSPATVGCG